MGWVLWDMRCVHDSFFWMHETRKGGASWLCLFGISLQLPTKVTSPNIADTTFNALSLEKDAASTAYQQRNSETQGKIDTGTLGEGCPAFKDAHTPPLECSARFKGPLLVLSSLSHANLLNTHLNAVHDGPPYALTYSLQNRV
jgi:hypothetical protein